MKWNDTSPLDLAKMKRTERCIDQEKDCSPGADLDKIVKVIAGQDANFVRGI